MYLSTNVWRCTINPEDIESIKIKNEFWKDVLKSWSQYNFYGNTRIENQIIWYNSHIKINKKIFLLRDALNNGLLYVHQLFKDRKFKSKEQVMNQYGLTTLRYNSLKTALPLEWKKYFMEQDKECFFPIPPHKYDRCIKCTQATLV